MNADAANVENKMRKRKEVSVYFKHLSRKQS